MTGTPLKSLTLTAFRGSCGTFTLGFEAGRKLTLVYGENGTGKTTICDGFEFLARGDVGSLNKRGLGGSLEKYWPSADKTLADIEVVLETHSASEKCTGRFVGKQMSVEPAEHRPLVELLRQQQITELIETAPAKRYEALQRFIDVVEVEQSEAALRKLVDELEADKRSAEASELESFAALQGLFEAAAKPGGTTALAWAKSLLSNPEDGAGAELDAVEGLRAVMVALGAYPALAEQHEAAVTAAEAALADAQQVASATISGAAADAAEIVQVLQAGRKYLQTHANPTACPLCTSAEKVSGLADTIEARLGQLAAVQDAQANLFKCTATRQRALSARSQLNGNYQQSLTDYAAAKSAHAWSTAYEFPPSEPPVAMTDLKQWLEDAAPASDSWAQAEATLRQGAERLKAVKSAHDRYETNRARKAGAEAALPSAKAALEICVKTRQTFTDKIMAEIATQVGELYEKVHPGEGLEKIALQLDPKKRASVEMQAKFSGKDVPPPAYFSQSHLDTLGLCVFLALALRDKPNTKILILDDVLGSVDEPHVERVIGMIYGVSEKFRHTIITTHYRPWREKFRWGELKPDQQCQFVELVPWTMTGGLRSKSTLPEIARLKKLLAEDDPDIQGITGKAGVILEEILDYLTLKYGCAVPRRHGDAYTLGDLLPNINGKLLTALRVEILTPVPGAAPTIVSVELKPILDDLRNIAQTRNVLGAHFNKISFDLYPADGIKFAKQVETLADALVCPDHGWPGRNKSGSHWSNGGDTRRLHPLQKPS